MISPEIRHMEETNQKVSEFQVADNEELEPLPF
jgi:hypothetical protein